MGFLSNLFNNFKKSNNDEEEFWILLTKSCINHFPMQDYIYEFIDDNGCDISKIGMTKFVANNFIMKLAGYTVNQSGHKYYSEQFKIMCATVIGIMTTEKELTIMSLNKYNELCDIINKEYNNIFINKMTVNEFGSLLKTLSITLMKM